MTARRSGLAVPVRVGLSLLGVAALWTAAARWGTLPSAVANDPTVLPIAIIGASLLALALAWSTRWRSAVALLGLATAGQASALQLIEAPRYAIYQHFIPWGRLLEAPGLVLGILAVQAIVCLWLTARARRTFLMAARDLVRALSVGRISGGFVTLAVLGVLAFSAVVPTASIARTAGEFVLAGAVAILALLNLVLVARAVPAESMARARAWLDQRVTLDASREELRPWDTAVPWLVALFVIVSTGVVSWFVMERMPHIDDSISYLFQAKYLSTGRLYLPAPPDSASFHVAEVIVDGPKWFGYGFPGWPAMLALGVWARVAWLVNPVLAGITVLVAHRLVRLLFSRSTAHLSVCLLALSPWFIFTSASFMGHAFALMLGLVALLAVELDRQRRASRWAAMAGVAIGVLFLTRPIEALFVGTIAALWMLGMGGSRVRLRSLLAYAVLAAGVAAMVFPYNAALTGKATYAPHMMWTDRTWGAGVDRLGFGPHIGIPAWTNIDPIPGHGVIDVVLNTNKNLFMANVELFGWACGSLLLVLLGVPLIRRRRPDWLLILLVLLVVVGHSAYWFSGGPDFGPRYWYQAILPLVVLTVRGAEALGSRMSIGHAAARYRVAAFVAAATVSAAVTILPWRSLTKHYRYRDVGGAIRTLAQQHGFHHALVFVHTPDRAVYQSAFNLNPPTLADSATIYAFDAGRANRERVVGHFRDRPVWVIGPRSETDPTLGVLAGPLPAGTVPPDSVIRRSRAAQMPRTPAP